MAAKHFQLDQEPGNEEESTIHQQEEEYEAEEILSLCDLPIYSSDSSKSDGFSKEDDRSSSSCNNDGDDFFEFSSEEFTATTPANGEKKNIIFCGKIIPYKEDSQDRLKFEGIPKLQKKIENDTNFPYSSTKKRPCSAGKVSLMRSNTKSSWFLFLFGMSRLPVEMELGDLRIRRQRKQKVMAVKTFTAAEDREVVKSKGKKNGGWRRVFKLMGLGRKSKQANDVVNGSFIGA